MQKAIAMHHNWMIDFFNGGGWHGMLCLTLGKICFYFGNIASTPVHEEISFYAGITLTFLGIAFYIIKLYDRWKNGRDK